MSGRCLCNRRRGWGIQEVGWLVVQASESRPLALIATYGRRSPHGITQPQVRDKAGSQFQPHFRLLPWPTISLDQFATQLAAARFILVNPALSMGQWHLMRLRHTESHNGSFVRRQKEYKARSQSIRDHNLDKTLTYFERLTQTVTLRSRKTTDENDRPTNPLDRPWRCVHDAAFHGRRA